MSSVADRLDVIDTCTRMAWYIDSGAWEALAEVFSEEIRLDYTSLNGGEPAVLSRKELIGSTRVVILFMFLMVLFLFVADIVFGYLFYWMTVLKIRPFL